jgi:heptosyltransferase-2
MATPVFECLRNNLPDANITALVRPYARGILEDSPWFNQIIDCDDKSLAGLKRIKSQMQSIQPQAGLLLTNSAHSYLTFRFAGIAKIYGYKLNIRKYLITDGPTPALDGKRVKAMPMQQYYLDLCKYLGLDIPKNPTPSLYISQQLSDSGADTLIRYGIIENELVIGINPGASFGSSKCWPAEHFAQLCDLLKATHQCKILLFAGPGEAEIATKIVQMSNASIINTASDNIDLALLKPLIKRCNLLITNDTGPRHYAVALGVPNVVLMGPTNPLFTDSNMEKTTVIQRDLPCIPCHKKICPLGHHACMQEITPNIVLDSANSIISGATA